MYKRQVISEAGGIVMDKTAHTVAIDGRNIELSVKEFELLDYFMSNQGIALTRERILDSCLLYTSRAMMSMSLKRCLS